MRSTVLIIHSAKLNGTRHVPTQYSSHKANVVYSTFHLQLSLPSIFTFKKAGSQHEIKLRKTSNFIVPSSSYFSTLWSQKNAVIMKSSVTCWTLNFVLNSFRSGPTRQALVLICTVKTQLEQCSRIMHLFYAVNTKLYIIKDILIKTKDDKRDVARKEEKYMGSSGRKI